MFPSYVLLDLETTGETPLVGHIKYRIYIDREEARTDVLDVLQHENAVRLQQRPFSGKAVFQQARKCLVQTGQFTSPE